MKFPIHRLDKRISESFLNLLLVGGSCFQRYFKLVYLCRQWIDQVAEFWHQVIKINNYQKKRFAYKTIQELSRRKTQIWHLGWAFKRHK